MVRFCPWFFDVVVIVPPFFRCRGFCLRFYDVVVFVLGFSMSSFCGLILQNRFSSLVSVRFEHKNQNKDGGRGSAFEIHGVTDTW